MNWKIHVRFGKRLSQWNTIDNLFSLTTLLTNRKETILSTIRDAEQRYQEAVEKLNQAKTRLEEAQAKANEIRQNGISQIEKEKQELINAAEKDSKRLNDSKNDSIRFEEQKIIEQIKQKVSRLALKRAFEVLNNRLNLDLHARMINYHIGVLTEMDTFAN
jgi:F-type H+-transporting ATPase subunit b